MFDVTVQLHDRLNYKQEDSSETRETIVKLNQLILSIAKDIDLYILFHVQIQLL